jgi:uncharacterized protein (DUF2141 family)
LKQGKYDQIKLDGKNLMTETGINGEQNKYKSGWEKVRDLWDKNGDGKITGDELKSVYIWQDKNGDGKVDKDELKLLQIGILKNLILKRKLILEKLENK